jgi:hypothetical protein
MPFKFQYRGREQQARMQPSVGMKHGRGERRAKAVVMLHNLEPNRIGCTASGGPKRARWSLVTFF